MPATLSASVVIPNGIFIGVDGVTTKINKNAMAVAAVSIMSYFFMNNMWATCF